ncbi:MAG: TatD family hydrolase [Alcanivoracaceae bacterium]|nr:TatD family hydrolase [Alcanivoracaceae bacterium]
MTTIVDSHCHLNCIDLSSFDNGMDTILQNAKDVGVKHFLCVCIDMEHFPEVLQLAKRYPFISASVGMHPTETSAIEPDIETLEEYGKDSNIVAIGETGLDYYRENTNKILQQTRLVKHIEVAKRVSKPLIIHTRSAREDTIKFLKEEKASDVGGVMHCFTETWEMAKQALDLGFYISISGIVTFKNAAELREVARKVPQDRLLIETDSPYLAPVPYRGKTNQPAYVRIVAEELAKIRNEDFETLAHTTTQNFEKLFKLKVSD